MDAGIVAALISSVVSALVAVAATVWTHRQGVEMERIRFELDRSTRDSEKRSAAKTELDRYREPLLVAAFDLGTRIHSIRKKEFLSYLKPTSKEPDRRSRLALLATLFCIARYFGTLEIVYSRLALLRFESAEDTRVVAALLADIGGAFSSDEYDRVDTYHSSRFMLWREEQRAIGELMRGGPGSASNECLGFAYFHDNYEAVFAEWFDAFAEALQSPAAITSARLARVQTLLALLVGLLDEEGAFTLTVGGERIAPDWVTPTGLA
ncbi:hypothetical protein Ga0074812_103228 [Parafrankia irregularis]|uniref:Uncharacterized protein n=1 Tax=Parafrankia irregularis TaxID=795642 RepID=A0A0S4QI24_9ACTN|nr:MULTISPECIES: hypothetical protein [Parafrankia]MBE3200867.1 hypothetical protein [Parafrankia sp. CH37]CUU54738.1 hypothetical protein Ga0074812_103228 [Parafrankia irregularis]